MQTKVRATAVLTAAMLALALTACGEEKLVVDDAAAESFAKEEVKRLEGARLASVDCPADVEVEKGKKFECDAVDPNGETGTVTMEIVDDDGNFSYVGVKAD